MGAGAECQDRRRTRCRLLENRLGGAAADREIDPVVVERHRAGHDQQVLAGVVLHRRLQRRFGRVARGGHQGVRVVERDQVEDQVADGRLGGPDHALDAAGALLQLDPDHAGPLLGLQRGGHPLGRAAAETEDHTESTGKLEKVSSRHTVLGEVFAEGVALGPGMGQWSEHVVTSGGRAIPPPRETAYIGLPMRGAGGRSGVSGPAWGVRAADHGSWGYHMVLIVGESGVPRSGEMPYSSRCNAEVSARSFGVSGVPWAVSAPAPHENLFSKR